MERHPRSDRFGKNYWNRIGEQPKAATIVEKPAIFEEAIEAEKPVGFNRAPLVTFLNKTEMVDLVVGPEKAIFRVHKSFLCNKIPYFSAMFNSGFKEAEENSATFPEDLPESFDILIQWVYSGHIRHYECHGPARPETWNFLQFYSLAEKLCLMKVQDRVLDIYRNSCRAENCTFNLSWATEAYEITPDQSALRRFVIQMLVFMFHTTSDSGQNGNEHFIQAMKSNDEIFTDFMLALRKHVKSSIPVDPRVSDPKSGAIKCEYHTHTKDEDCYRFKKT
ncbi:hypothetical protein NHQ30_002077 [Ciborinia camelliae]|nr:hypothetical protein NHQ30_002077 [Ciborinia camelliae]